MAAMSALSTLACGPSSHSMGRASIAVLACHHLSAITATASSPTATTFLTPGMAITFDASKDFSLAPNRGYWRIAALTMPGSFKSVP